MHASIKKSSTKEGDDKIDDDDEKDGCKKKI